MITLFEKYKQKPDVNSLSDEFWKMVKFANWNKFIKDSKKEDFNYIDTFEKVKFKIFSKYSYEEVHNFFTDCHTLYYQLYDYFKDIWLDKKYSDFMPSDDGYVDFISSIIGKGKEFTKKCIDDEKVFIKMAKNEDYAENFVYFLQSDEDEYWEIRSLFDPLVRDTRKFDI